MKWYTCTPVAFGGGADFFARDSGLLSRGFSAIGVESRAVMPGQKQSDDMDELIRTDYHKLESADWWESLGIDGLVLYAWGRPRFRKVAAAVKQAGIRLVLNQDSGGLVSPRLGLGPWLAEQQILSGSGRMPGGRVKFLGKALRGLSIGLMFTDPRRAIHLRQGDWITAVSPVASEHYRKLCELYGGMALSEKVAFVPHPVGLGFRYDGRAKEHRLISVGRWGDECQKRTSLLVEVLNRLLESDALLEIDLVGQAGGALDSWHESLEDRYKARVKLWGRLEPERINELFQVARVAYCSSAFESFHIASAEALCCGASVVAGRSLSLASFEWFVSDGDGSLAQSDDADGHTQALKEELGAWEAGARDAAAISNRWCDRVHAPKVAGRILGLFDSKE